MMKIICTSPRAKLPGFHPTALQDYSGEVGVRIKYILLLKKKDTSTIKNISILKTNFIQETDNFFSFSFFLSFLSLPSLFLFISFFLSFLH